MKGRIDIKVSERVLKSLVSVQARTEAPSMAELTGAIVEIWLRERRLLQDG